MLLTTHPRVCYWFIAVIIVELLVLGCMGINPFSTCINISPTELARWTSSSSRREHRVHIYTSFYRPWNITGNINCTKLATGDRDLVDEANKVMNRAHKQSLSAEFYANISDCKNFTISRGYIQDPLSGAEESFPLAFGLVVYKDVEQAERLLRAIYRPQNYYCFHVDSKSESLVKAAFKKLAGCFPNVFLVDAPVDVRRGLMTVLGAELLLMECLWRYKWKYYINLTGQEFPLKTNREIVEILMAMQGANVVLGREMRSHEELAPRFQYAGPPPHGIKPIIGSVHVAINRDFVDFSLHDKRSKDFIKWLKKTMVPDETFFASLNHNPQLGIPGSFLGEAEEYPKKPFFMRYKNWTPGNGVYHRKCFGKIAHEICILGVGDIHKALDDIGLFANKFFLDFEYLGLDCLEKYLYERTWDQYLNERPVDVTYYEQLDQVKYQLRNNGT